MQDDRSSRQFGSHFPDTSWGLVLAARDDAFRRGAFDSLCERYWKPVYASLRRQGFAATDAEDLTQGFFLHLIERDTVARADPQRGRFRCFLLGALRWFLANHRERESARKRGAGFRFVSIDTTVVESPRPAETPGQTSLELQFDREWARTLVSNALDQLRAEYAARDQLRDWTTLHVCLDPGADLPTYAELANQLDTSEGAIKVAVHRLRRRFRELLRAEVECTVATAEDIDDELRHLRSVLAAALVAGEAS